MTLVAASLMAFGVVVLPSPASAAVGDCPPGFLPGPGSGNPVWTDNNVAVYAGGDFLATASAAEVEGLLVVGGDADFDKTSTGTFNVGWVGVGSGVSPSPGSVMLAVGGTLTVGAATILDVGANAVDPGGDGDGGAVTVGGLTDPDYVTDGSRYRLNGGVLAQDLGAAALTEWAAWPALLSQQSADFAALPATGTVSAGATLTLTGDGSSDPQVFSVDAATLAANPAITFAGLADDVPVIVNVTGGPITWSPNYFADESGRVDVLTSPRFGIVAARTLWNFVDATSVHLDGTSQVLGSILVPNANPDPAQPTLRVTASTNGRLLTNGSLVMDGVGNEHHNYPWLLPPFECIPVDPGPQSGSVTILKLLDPGDQALIPADATFHGHVYCAATPTTGAVIAEWQTTPGTAAVVDDLPVGAACVVEEAVGVTARLIAQPRGRSTDVGRTFAWADPVWNPSPPTFVVPAPGDPDAQVSFTVTNALASGSFVIRKTVRGAIPLGLEFTGTWACELPVGTPVMSGVWALEAGEVTDPIEPPVGATCSVTENTPPPVTGGTWQPPTITGSPAVITSGSATTPIEIEVLNALTPTPLAGGFSIVKVVQNDEDVVFTDGFSGAWTCTVAGEEPLTGTWTLSSSSPPLVVTGVPTGAQCTVAETQPPDPTGGQWGVPVITPSSFTVVDVATPVAVTITNTLGPADPVDPVDPSLPVTGGEGAAWLAPFGLGAIGLGGTLLLASRRRIFAGRR